MFEATEAIPGVSKKKEICRPCLLINTLYTRKKLLKRLYLSDAEAITACQFVTPAKSWSICLAVKEAINIQGKLHQTFDHFLEWSVVSHHCSNILGYSVVVEVWLLNSGHTTVSLKISPGMVFLVFQVTNSPVTVNLLSNGHHAMDQYSKYLMDISVLSTVRRHLVSSKLWTVSPKFNTKQSITPRLSSLHTP